MGSQVRVLTRLSHNGDKAFFASCPVDGVKLVAVVILYAWRWRRRSCRGSEWRKGKSAWPQRSDCRRVITQLALPEMPTGAAHLRWPAGIPPEGLFNGKPTAVFALLRQTFKTDQRTGWTEQGSALCCFVATPDGEAQPIEGTRKQVLLRALTKGVVRIKPEDEGFLSTRLKEMETQLCTSLRRPTETEIRDGIRHSVAPMFAAIITS